MIYERAGSHATPLPGTRPGEWHYAYGYRRCLSDLYLVSAGPDPRNSWARRLP